MRELDAKQSQSTHSDLISWYDIDDECFVTVELPSCPPLVKETGLS
jgi:hypothetical protein